MIEVEALFSMTNTRLSRWATSRGVPAEWATSAAEDSVLWFRTLDNKPADTEDSINICVSVAKKAAMRDWMRFEHGRRRDANVEILPLHPFTSTSGEEDSMEDKNVSFHSEDPVQISCTVDVCRFALSLMPDKYRVPLLEAAQEATTSTDIVDGAVALSDVSKSACFKQLSRFRARLRKNLDLSPDAGWKEVRRELWNRT